MQGLSAFALAVVLSLGIAYAVDPTKTHQAILDASDALSKIEIRLDKPPFSRFFD